MLRNVGFDVLQQAVTVRNDPTRSVSEMPLEIAGLEYLTVAEVCRVVHVSRQTLWRWRQDARIPPGRRFRGQRLVFSPDELEQIRRYASLLEPADQPSKVQLSLFNSHARRAG